MYWTHLSGWEAEGLEILPPVSDATDLRKTFVGTIAGGSEGCLLGQHGGWKIVDWKQTRLDLTFTRVGIHSPGRITQALVRDGEAWHGTWTNEEKVSGFIWLVATKLDPKVFTMERTREVMRSLGIAARCR